MRVTSGDSRANTILKINYVNKNMNDNNRERKWKVAPCWMRHLEGHDTASRVAKWDPLTSGGEEEGKGVYVCSFRTPRVIIKCTR